MTSFGHPPAEPHNFIISLVNGDTGGCPSNSSHPIKKPRYRAENFCRKYFKFKYVCTARYIQLNTSCLYIYICVLQGIFKFIYIYIYVYCKVYSIKYFKFIYIYVYCKVYSIKYFKFIYICVLQGIFN